MKDFIHQFNQMLDSWEEDLDGYHGVLYSRLYPGSVPQSYQVRWTKERTLTWSVFEKNPDFHRTHDTVDFDASETVTKFKNDPGIVVYPITEYEFYICSKDVMCPFFLKMMADGKHSHDAWTDVICEDIDKTMDWIGKYFVAKEAKEDECEFGIASVSDGELHTSWYDMKLKYDIDVKKNYNDDLPYERILELLEDETQADLILFYGAPGTGKSSLIKKLITELPDKEFIFLDACVLASIQPARFVNFLTENENCVLILEDCEKILTSREIADNGIMSTILNITDGVISDILGIKLICTFNTALHKIDDAILRKGRLSLKYEFKKLDKEKAKALGAEGDSTLADIFNKDENDYSKKVKTKIGF